MLQLAENANGCDETAMNEGFSLACLLVILWRCENAGECILHILACLYARFGVSFFYK